MVRCSMGGALVRCSMGGGGVDYYHGAEAEKKTAPGLSRCGQGPADYLVGAFASFTSFHPNPANASTSFARAGSETAKAMAFS